MTMHDGGAVSGPLTGVAWIIGSGMAVLVLLYAVAAIDAARRRRKDG